MIRFLVGDARGGAPSVRGGIALGGDRDFHRFGFLDVVDPLRVEGVG